MERDARVAWTQGRHSKATDESFLHRGMREVEIVVPYDDVEIAADRNKPPERLEDLRVGVCDRLEPLNARGNGPDARHSRVESCEIERVAEENKPDPGTCVAELRAELVDETRQFERRVVLVRRRMSALR